MIAVPFSGGAHNIILRAADRQHPTDPYLQVSFVFQPIAHELLIDRVWRREVRMTGNTTVTVHPVYSHTGRMYRKKVAGSRMGKSNVGSDPAN